MSILKFFCYGNNRSLNIPELFRDRFSSSKKFNLSQSSLGFSGKSIVEIPEALIACG